MSYSAMTFIIDGAHMPSAQLLSRFRFVSCIILLTTLLFAPSIVHAAGEDLPYKPADPELAVIKLDSSPNESFLSMRTDSTGRLFVGGREALFVYELDDSGKYQPRKELYRFPADSWVYDIEIRGNDLYILTLNALYLIPNGVVQRENLKPQRLVWGVPQGHVHQCLHELAWGPEGDLYISMGDPLWYYGDFDRPDHWGHWTFFCQPDDTKVPYTGVGGVFRCRPDGSNFQIVSRGMRNSCGLVFDNRWNLFSNDNDHEGSPHAYVPGKLMHVTPHADFSWPRGWMPHITPDRADILETMFDGMGRAVPVGQSYYDDDYLGAKYRNNLLVARWGIRTVTRYPIEHRGASFKAKEFPLIVGRDLARPVGVTVGRGGRIFATIAFMAHNEGSPVYPSDLIMLTRAGDNLEGDFPSYEAATAEPLTLFEELDESSWDRRRRAHLELLRRGGDMLIEAAARLQNARLDDPALLHLVWLAAARAGEKEAQPGERESIRKLLERLAMNRQNDLRVQTYRALHEYFPTDAALHETWARGLQDSDPQVRQAALIALFDAPEPLPWKEIARQAESADSYLRQPASLLLAERAPRETIAELGASESATARLAGVLAAGFRITMPPVSAPIPEPLPLAPWREEAVYKVTYADKQVDLRELGRIGLFTLAEHWKASKHTDDQEAMFSLLQSRLENDPEERVRLQAAHFLYLLNDARTEPAIAKLRTDTEQRRLATVPLQPVKTAWVVGPFPDGGRGLNAPHPPEQGAIDLSATYDTPAGKMEWKTVTVDRLIDFKKTFGNCDDASCYAYIRIESPRKQQMMFLPGSDDGIRIWQNGKVVWNNETSRAALPFQDVLFVELQPGSNDFLLRVNNIDGESALYMHYRTLTEVSAVLPEKLGTATLAERLKEAAADPATSKVAAEFLTVDWSQAAKTGDAERGKKLFSADGIGCAKCHAVDANAPTTGGPSLAGAASRFTLPYLVESVLLPSKMVSPVFRGTAVVTKDGKSASGLVVGETGEKIELLLNDATRKTIPKTEIEDRKLQDVSPMPAGLLKTPDELRDLLAYLQTLR